MRQPLQRQRQPAQLTGKPGRSLPVRVARAADQEPGGDLHVKDGNLQALAGGP
jgi:hypothetical protein